MSFRLLSLLAFLAASSGCYAEVISCQRWQVTDESICNMDTVQAVLAEYTNEFEVKHSGNIPSPDVYFRQIEACEDAACRESIAREWLAEIRHLNEPESKPASNQPLVSAEAVENTASESNVEIKSSDAEQSISDENTLELQSAPPAASTPILPGERIQSTEQRSTNSASESDKLSSDMVTVMWLVVAAIGIGLLIAGASNRVVIYYNGKEMAVSFLAVALPIIAASMFDSAPFESSLFNWIFHWIASPITGIIGIFCLALNFQQAIKHNRNIFLGVFVGAFKLVFVTLTFLVVMEQTSRMMDKKSSFKDAAVAAIILAATVAIAKAMINGPKTYEAKGWIDQEAESNAA